MGEASMECMVLRCFEDQGRVVDIDVDYRQINPEISGEGGVDDILQIRESAWSGSEKRANRLPGRVLLLKGHTDPILSPGDFAEGAGKHPDLVLPKMGRYYPNLPIEAPKNKKKRKGNSPFLYRATLAGSGFAEELITVSVVTKNHLEDRFELTELMIDRNTPALSILQYLADMTDGRFQAVAAFQGSRSFLSFDSSSAEPAESRRRDSLSDPMTKTFAALLDAALVRQGFLAEDPDAPLTRSLAWLGSILKERAVLALETDIPFCEQAIAQAARETAGLSLVVLQPAAPPDMSLGFEAPSRPSCVVFPMSAYSQLIDPERAVYEILNGGHSALIGCNRIAALPEPLRRIIETTISLPRMDPPVFEKLFIALFGAKPVSSGDMEGNNAWIQYVQPWDMARIAHACQDPHRAFVMLRHRVEDRLKRVTPGHGPSLSDLHGLGEAKIRAEMLINDIQAAAAGEIPWSQVDRGMLLAGPPGCGKTALARAIAKDCGVRFVECSAARWQMVNHLGEHLSAMARDFAEARRFEPSILFIDEIDSIGNRENFSGSNASYHTQVVNALLAEMQGFSNRGKVIIIAATNDAENVDPALRRAGRLDRVVKVSLPTIDALEKIIAYYLEKNNAPLEDASDISLRPLAEAAFGRTGADVSLMVRGALRRARLSGRPLCQDDLLAELYQRPLDRDLDRPLSGEGIRRVALHEAGHAMVRMKSGSAFGHIAFISIVPRPDGSLGFVAMQPNVDAVTLNRADFLAHLQVILAGRAAEEIFYGKEGIGAGAGGSESSDLSKATAMALNMVCHLGLGRESQLLWREAPSAEDFEEAETLLTEAYDQAKALITAHRPLVEQIAALLIERQEISGDELKKLIF